MVGDHMSSRFLKAHREYIRETGEQHAIELTVKTFIKTDRYLFPFLLFDVDTYIPLMSQSIFGSSDECELIEVQLDGGRDMKTLEIDFLNDYDACHLLQTGVEVVALIDGKRRKIQIGDQYANPELRDATITLKNVSHILGEDGPTQCLQIEGSHFHILSVWVDFEVWKTRIVYVEECERSEVWEL